MKSIISLFILFLYAIISLQTQIVYSQTTLDYIEQQRIEKKDNKIKTISTFEYVNDALAKKEYYDENGNLRKREMYVFNLETNKVCLWQEIVISKISTDGLYSGIVSIFEQNGTKINDNPFENMKPEIFYEIAFDETLIEDVKYIFDNKGNLIEKRYFSEDMYKPGEYEKEILVYNSNNKLKESKHYIPGSSTVSLNKYYYNSTGLLEKEESSYDFQKGDRVYGVKYQYEFYTN